MAEWVDTKNKMEHGRGSGKANNFILVPENLQGNLMEFIDRMRYNMGK
jgi:hypothetical protein